MDVLVLDISVFVSCDMRMFKQEAGSRKRKGEESKTMKIMVKGKGAVDVDSKVRFDWVW
jgi:hypothetical protein